MSEWKQNERRTSGFPEGIEEGMVLDVKFRNGDIERRTVGYQEGSDLDWLSTAHFNTNYGYSVDVMAYRVVGETAAAPAIQPKTAIELQAEEVGIPEPVRLVDDAKPDADGYAPTTAPDFLQSAINTLTQRGKDYDKPEGERSAEAVAVAFNAITGRNLTEAEVWLVLQLVKDVRQWQNPDRYHADSALDCVAYAALKAEALAGSGK